MKTEQLLTELRSNYSSNITSADIRGFCASRGVSYPTVVKKLDDYKISRGKWNLDLTVEKEILEKTMASPSAIPANEQNLIPKKDDNFVKFGNFSDIKKIIQSNLFYPTFVTGLSGNGKTFSIEQACAQLGRELIRVNMTIETDESDLIGSMRLTDPRGNTVTEWEDGPVVTAMKRGAILLLDEVDLASNKILCLQPVLEGSGLYVKLAGMYVKPAKGFNVIATANTKGKGSEDGRFIGTNVLNEAFLERFAVTFEQEYPSSSVETKLLIKYAKSLGIEDDVFCKRLADWGWGVRKTFHEDAIDEIISTRRLVHILRAYSIFNDKAKAINICLNRFDDDTRQSFMDLYAAVDIDVDFQESQENN